MIKISSLAITFLILTAFGLHTASAQFRIPDIPRIKKPKAEQPPKRGAESAPAAAPAAAAKPTAAPAPTTSVSAAGSDQPTVVKDSVQVTASTNSSYRKNFAVWSWVPSITFRVNGPIPSGSQLYVEYTIPGGAPVKFDCPTQETQKDHWSETQCGGQKIAEDKRSIYTGPVNFTIKMRNELAGTDSTLFTGKMKVAKARSNTHGPQAANHFVYYVDHELEPAHRLHLLRTASGVGLGPCGVPRRVLGARERGAPAAPPVLPGQGNRRGLRLWRAGR